MLSTHQLSVHGSKDRLVERHRQWVNLYNANLDASALHRDTLAQLRRQLQQWEHAQEKGAVKGKPSSERQDRAWLVRTYI